MAKSFLLRDAAGRVGGYLICAEGTFSLKTVGCEKDGVFAALQGGDGAVQRIPVCCDGQEHTYGYAGEIDRAALFDEKGILLSSDRKGAVDGEWACSAIESERTDEDRENEEKNGSALEDAHMRRQEQSKRSLPERRWPPPACMPGARYHHGVWSDEQVFAMAEGRPSGCSQADHSG